MNIRSYLIIMALTTITAWIAWVLVLHGVDPTRAGTLGFFLFYLTFIMAVFGTILILGLLIRLWRPHTQLPSRLAMRSFRQAILLSVLITSSLILFSHLWFRWWTMLLVVMIVTLVEMAFLSSRNS
jgi:hypothetical protein